MDPSASRLFSPPPLHLCEATARHWYLLALLAHFPFPISSHLPLFQSILRTPSARTNDSARGPLPRPQHATRRPPRRRAIEGSADAEAACSPPTHTIHTAPAPASAPAPANPALAPLHLPTHGLRKASDLPKARHSTGKGRVRDLGPFGPHLGPLGALKFGRAGLCHLCYTRDLRGSPKE
ncbi:hypothetical protein B0H14DRAFT_1035154 [Mycena olivaceomarginata]|nr:hypothetical protein B0H14DRAFT_1035154 [Mycena olivaceomarginata]